jgi:hypothetical protein
VVLKLKPAGTQGSTDHVEEPAGRQRPMRRDQREKDLAVATPRADPREIADQGGPGCPGQWVRLDTVALHAPEMNQLTVPVDVVHGEVGDFADTEPVHGEEPQDRSAPNVGRTIRSAACQNRLDVGPGRARRQRFLGEEPRPSDRGSDAGPTVPRLFGVAKEGPERLDRHRHRPSAPGRAPFGGQEGVDVVNRDVRKGAALRPVPGEKRLGLPAVGSDRRGRQPPLVAQVGRERRRGAPGMAGARPALAPATGPTIATTVPPNTESFASNARPSRCGAVASGGWPNAARQPRRAPRPTPPDPQGPGVA